MLLLTPVSGEMFTLLQTTYRAICCVPVSFSSMHLLHPLGSLQGLQTAGGAGESPIIINGNSEQNSSIFLF